jgi:guanylate kinase
MIKTRGSVFVVSAPSGAGKTTLCQAVTRRVSRIHHSVSYTTRPRRAQEVDGVHYSFVDEEEFRTMVAEGEFVEWAQVHNHFYGTSRRRLDETLNGGDDILLDIDVQGARQLKHGIPESILIFILPPSPGELERRLVGRGSDSGDTIQGRLTRARDEISEYRNYRYVIVNDDFDRALAALEAIITAERAAVNRVDDAWIRAQFLKEA